MFIHKTKILIHKTFLLINKTILLIHKDKMLIHKVIILNRSARTPIHKAKIPGVEFTMIYGAFHFGD